MTKLKNSQIACISLLCMSLSCTVVASDDVAEVGFFDVGGAYLVPELGQVVALFRRNNDRGEFVNFWAGDNLVRYGALADVINQDGNWWDQVLPFPWEQENRITAMDTSAGLVGIHSGGMYWTHCLPSVCDQLGLPSPMGQFQQGHFDDLGNNNPNHPWLQLSLVQNLSDPNDPLHPWEYDEDGITAVAQAYETGHYFIFSGERFWVMDINNDYREIGTNKHIREYGPDVINPFEDFYNLGLPYGSTYPDKITAAFTDGQDNVMTLFDSDLWWQVRYENNFELINLGQGIAKRMWDWQRRTGFPRKNDITGVWRSIGNRVIPNDIREIIENWKGVSNEIHNFDSDLVSGSTNGDWFGVLVNLDNTGLSATDILDMLRDTPNDIRPDSEFDSSVTWNADTNGVPDNGVDRQPGEVVRLDLVDDGSIAYFDVSMSDGEVCAITVESNYSGGRTHPVSGIRCWGYREINEHGKRYYMFYTTGVDGCNRIAIACSIGGDAQQSTWKNLMKDIGWLVNQRGGTFYETGNMFQNQDIMRTQKRNGQTVIPNPSTAVFWTHRSE